jgi:cytochrome c oxidase assembly factor CtaG
MSITPLALSSAPLGGLALFFALIWPLNAFSETSFAMHMAQHMLLIAVAGPLLALARISIPAAAAIAAVSPATARAVALPRKWLRLPITFAPRPLYFTYTTTQGSIELALRDQQLAGLLMSIPVGACYLIGGLAFAAAWLRSADQEKERRL